MIVRQLKKEKYPYLQKQQTASFNATRKASRKEYALRIRPETRHGSPSLLKPLIGKEAA